MVFYQTWAFLRPGLRRQEKALCLFAMVFGLACFCGGVYFACRVTVTMTFDEHAITDMTIDVSGETPDIGGKIGGEMRDKILAAQTCNVDGVSGATVTADAIKAAAADCISQASGQAVTVGGSSSEGGSDWLGQAPEIAEADITETLDTEVLVVGCGTGGWITAMTTAEEGARVLWWRSGKRPSISATTLAPSTPASKRRASPRTPSSPSTRWRPSRTSFATPGATWTPTW